MADRVLSTTQAKTSIVKMQEVIKGSLMQQIDALNKEGQTLSDPNVWDGNLAQKFRGTWPEYHSTLTKAQNALQELSQQIQAINDDIMRAGGN